jgi:hypothetical protein
MKGHRESIRELKGSLPHGARSTEILFIIAERAEHGIITSLIMPYCFGMGLYICAITAGLVIKVNDE